MRLISIPPIRRRRAIRGCSAPSTMAWRKPRDDALRFAATFRPGNLRASFGSLPLVQDQLSEIETLLDVNERLLGSIAGDADAGFDAGQSPGRVRYVVIENAIRAVEIAVRIAGQHGLNRDYPLERRHRDVIGGRTRAPNGAIVRAAAAKAALATYRHPEEGKAP